MWTRAPPSTGSATPVMKLASSEARNKAAFATSHAVPILWRKGTRASRAAATSPRLFPLTRALVSTAIGADAELVVPDGYLLREGDHGGLGRLVRHIGILLPGRDLLDHDDAAGALR